MGCSFNWSEQRPVKSTVAGSSPVTPAKYGGVSLPVEELVCHISKNWGSTPLVTAEKLFEIYGEAAKFQTKLIEIIEVDLTVHLIETIVDM